MAHPRLHFATGFVYLVATFFCGVAAAAEPAASANSHRVRWYNDLQQAHRVALQQNKPLLLLFVRKSCIYCRKLEALTLASEKIQTRLLENFVPVVLDLDRNERAAQILKIQGVPTTVILTPQAVQLARADGFLGVDEYNTLLVKAANRYSQLSRVRETAARAGAAVRR